jgi:hypothetical protein
MVDKSASGVISSLLRHLTSESRDSWKERVRNITRKWFDIEAECQQNTNRKLGSGFRRKTFSPLAVASIAAELA